MANQKQGPTRPCRIFLCYRRETAQTAITFKGIMDRDTNHEYGNIWYSNLEGVGNFILDIPNLISEAEWVIFFVGKAFTAGFLDENEINPDCVTAQELIWIEKERQKRKHEGKPFHLMTVNVDGGYFDRQCVKDIKQLFLVAGILQEDSVATYKGLNQNPYHSVSTLPHDFIEEHIAPYCALSSVKNIALENGLSIGTAKNRQTIVKNQDVRIPPSVQKAMLNFSNALEYVGNSITNGWTNSAELRFLKNGNVLFGSYPQTAEGERQPIEWLVLKRKEDRALLISRYALDAKRYNETNRPTSWADCTLRKWLNGTEENGFMQIAFTTEERKLILEDKVSANRNSRYNTNSGESTKDMVFLLSISEVKSFFSSDELRRCAPTDYAEKYYPEKQKVRTSKRYRSNGRFSCWWWLRSPGVSLRDAAHVYFGGSVNYDGNNIFQTNGVGVRPALWVQWPD